MATIPNLQSGTVAIAMTDRQDTLSAYWQFKKAQTYLTGDKPIVFGK